MKYMYRATTEIFYFFYEFLKLIFQNYKFLQVGFALVNEKGELPPGGDVWQFNFHFSLNEDMFSQVLHFKN